MAYIKFKKVKEEGIYMTNTATQQSLGQKFNSLKNSKPIQSINKLVSSVWGMVIIAALTTLMNVLAFEIVLYSFVAVYVLYVCLFCDDFLPLVCLFIFCYISPSVNQNPGRTENSYFFGGVGIAMIVILSVSLLAIILRIALDKNMGFGKMFKQKRKLTLGMLILGGAYLVSGLFSAYYLELAFKNILFAFVQFLSIFLLYFVFATTIDWKKVSKTYIAWLGVLMGLAVSFQVLNTYLVRPVIQNGAIYRSYLNIGWGTYNNVGLLTVMAIPFAFYLACTQKYSYIYLILATILMIATVFTCSRQSLLVGGGIYLLCMVITFFKAKDKKWFRISVGILIGITIIIASIFYKQILSIFEKVPTILNPNETGGTFNSNGRYDAYRKGWDAFIKNPIFGITFYPKGYSLYEHSVIAEVSAFLPPRWHSTIIQLLASCGIVGLLAYGFHRYQTIKLFVKKPTMYKSFIGLSILAMLGMSLIDCHFFNIGPTLIYSILLVFAENENLSCLTEHCATTSSGEEMRGVTSTQDNEDVIDNNATKKVNNITKNSKAINVPISPANKEKKSPTKRSKNQSVDIDVDRQELEKLALENKPKTIAKKVKPRAQ